MEELAIARAVHVAAVVLWIGGVGFVTTALLPGLKSLPPGERAGMFQRFRRRFAWQARITTLLAGASGFYLAWGMDAWSRFESLQFWWMHAMVCLWAVFTVMLFIAAPLAARRRKSELPVGDAERAFARTQAMHALLLALSLLTILGAVAGSHGLI